MEACGARRHPVSSACSPKREPDPSLPSAVEDLHLPYQNHIWRSGRVSSEASFDVVIGEGSQILIRFGGAVGQGVVRGVVSVMVRRF